MNVITSNSLACNFLAILRQPQKRHFGHYLENKTKDARSRADSRGQRLGFVPASKVISEPIKGTNGHTQP